MGLIPLFPLIQVHGHTFRNGRPVNICRFAYGISLTGFFILSLERLSVELIGRSMDFLGHASPFNRSRFFQPGSCRHFRLDNFIFHLLYYASFLFEREDAKSKALSRLYHTLSEAHYAAFITVNERTSPSSKKKRHRRPNSCARKRS